MIRIGQRAKLPSFNLGWRKHVREIVVVAGAYFVYMLVRRFLIPNLESVAFENAVKVTSFESAWGFFLEPKWQSWLIENSKVMVIFLNWAYIITFAPIICVTAIFVYMKDWPKYFYYRNVILMSFVFALLLFAVFPLAPPRFLPEYGFLDTLRSIGGPTSWYGGTDMAAAIYYNVFAAMPSLHFGWSILFGILYFRMGPAWLKVCGILYPTITLFAITLTGNHYIVDAIGGGAVALVSYLVYESSLRLKTRTAIALPLARAHLAQAGAHVHSTLLRWKVNAQLAFSAKMYQLKLERLSNGKWKTLFPVNISSAKTKRT